MYLLIAFVVLEIYVAIVAYWAGYASGHKDGWKYRQSKMRGGR